MSSVFDDIRASFNRTNNSSVQIILVNVFVFGGLFLFNFLLSFSEQTQPIVGVIQENLLLNVHFTEIIKHPWTLFTYGFLTESVWALLFNSLSLYYFGLLMQDFLGSRKLLNVYLLGFIFSGIVYFSAYHILSASKSEFYLPHVLRGASAGVYAVMFAAVTLIPDYEFYFFRLFYIRVKYIALLLLALSFLNPGYGIINLGGAFFGYFYIKLLRSGIDLGSPIEAVADWISGVGRKGPKKTFSAKKYSHSTVGNVSRQETQAQDYHYNEQEEIDALLDKISQSGYNSLSKDEKERLFKVSQSKNLKS